MLYRCHWRITGDVRCEIPYSMQYKLWSYATFLKLLTSQPWRGQHPALTLKSSQVSIIRGVHYLLHLLLQGIFNWKEKGRGGNESGIFHSFCSSLNTHSLFNLFSPQHHEQGITSTVRCGWMCLCLLCICAHRACVVSRRFWNPPQRWGGLEKMEREREGEQNMLAGSSQTAAD